MVAGKGQGSRQRGNSFSVQWLPECMRLLEHTVAKGRCETVGNCWFLSGIVGGS